jgi:hypothetical protein
MEEFCKKAHEIRAIKGAVLWRLPPALPICPPML